jgi:hypothetical protein
MARDPKPFWRGRARAAARALLDDLDGAGHRGVVAADEAEGARRREGDLAGRVDVRDRVRLVATGDRERVRAEVTRERHLLALRDLHAALRRARDREIPRQGARRARARAIDERLAGVHLRRRRAVGPRVGPTSAAPAPAAAAATAVTTSASAAVTAAVASAGGVARARAQAEAPGGGGEPDGCKKTKLNDRQTQGGKHERMIAKRREYG